MKNKPLPAYFRNLPFRRKIICLCLAVSMLPILLLGVFAHGQLRARLLERETLALQETLRQEADLLEYKLNSYLSALNLIACNENIISALSDTYTSNSDMYLAYRDTIDPLFLTVCSLNGDISSICIYTELDIYPHGNILRPLKEAEDFPWYEQAEQSYIPFFRISENRRNLYLVCKFYDKRLKGTNILCLTIDMDIALQSAATLFEENY